jgi:hypothetical protein
MDAGPVWMDVGNDSAQHPVLGGHLMLRPIKVVRLRYAWRKSALGSFLWLSGRAAARRRSIKH